MRRVITMVASCLIISACGGGIDTYEEGMDAYAEVMEEMLSVLEGVTYESSAEKAAGKIEALGNRLADVTTQIADLPQPDAKEMQEMAKNQRAKMQDFQQGAPAQMMKMAQYPVLLDAWMRAMENMR